MMHSQVSIARVQQLHSLRAKRKCGAQNMQPQQLEYVNEYVPTEFTHPSCQ